MATRKKTEPKPDALAEMAEIHRLAFQTGQAMAERLQGQLEAIGVELRAVRFMIGHHDDLTANKVIVALAANPAYANSAPDVIVERAHRIVAEAQKVGHATLEAGVRVLFETEGKIPAIKYYREVSGSSLLLAKTAVEEMAWREGWKPTGR